jgi:Domain of unknown function (DUF3854)
MVFSAPAKLTHQILGWPAGRALVYQYGRGFYRVKLDRKQKDGKQYRQRKSTVNHVYVPRVLPNREEVIKDPTIPKIITEGEKKAIKGCQEGLAVFSLPGVYGFLYQKEPIPDLDRFAWDGCRVEIVFDSEAKLGAQAKAQAEGFNAIVPPLAVVTDFPSKYVEIVRYWEKRDEGLIDPATLPSEDDPEAWPQAVSQAQVYWARRQLQKAKNGAPVPQSIAELEALANTPLAGLPERAGKKKLAKKATAKRTVKPRTATRRAKEA